MRKLFSSFIIVLLLLFIAACTNKQGKQKSSVSEADTVAVPDTGYTGIKQYFSNQRLLKEITFRNSIRDGLMKTYYQGGQLYQTFWYENGLREDSAVWYYVEGQPFRTTPYVNDTIHGIQKQYYRTGKIKARIGYEKGLRTTLFEEYDVQGRLYTDYPSVVTDIKDEYNTKGIYTINLSLSDNDERVQFYKGEFTDGRFDTTSVSPVETIKGKGSLILRKSESAQKNSASVIAEFTTPYGNRYLKYISIDLPYNDLK